MDELKTIGGVVKSYIAETKDLYEELQTINEAIKNNKFVLKLAFEKFADIVQTKVPEVISAEFSDEARVYMMSSLRKELNSDYEKFVYYNFYFKIRRPNSNENPADDDACLLEFGYFYNNYREVLVAVSDIYTVVPGTDLLQQLRNESN